MEAITADTARKHLNDYMARAVDGETFVLTRYGRPVCIMGPLPGPVTLTVIADQPTDGETR